MPEIQLKSRLADIRSILEFLTDKICDLELSESEVFEKTSLANVAAMCRKTPPSGLPGCVVEVQGTTAEQLPVQKVVVQDVPNPIGLAIQNPLSPSSKQCHACNNRLGSSEPHKVPSRADLDLHLAIKVKGHSWTPMTFKHISRKTRMLGHVRFYWIGLTNNLKLKDAYIAIKGMQTILSQRTDAMTANALKMIKLDQIRNLGGEGGSLTAKELECNVDIFLAQSNLARLEFSLANTWTADGLTTGDLFQMASCPFDQFLKSYILDRDDALERTDLVEKREELVKCITRGVAGLDVLCTHLEDRIAANDQLLFKILLLVINLLTCLGQFLYNDYVKKPRIYKCQL